MKSISIRDHLISPTGSEWVVDQINEDAISMVNAENENEWFQVDELQNWKNLGQPEQRSFSPADFGNHVSIGEIVSSLPTNVDSMEGLRMVGNDGKGPMSEELKPGDRVKHDTLGEGTIKFLAEAEREWGIAYLDIPGFIGSLVPVALNLLTKVEPESEMQTPALFQQESEFDEDLIRQQMKAGLMTRPNIEVMYPDIEREDIEKPEEDEDKPRRQHMVVTLSRNGGFCWCGQENESPRDFPKELEGEERWHCEGCGTIREDRHRAGCSVSYETPPTTLVSSSTPLQ